MRWSLDRSIEGTTFWRTDLLLAHNAIVGIQVSFYATVTLGVYRRFWLSIMQSKTFSSNHVDMISGSGIMTIPKYDTIENRLAYNIDPRK